MLTAVPPTTLVRSTKPEGRNRRSKSLRPNVGLFPQCSGKSNLYERSGVGVGESVGGGAVTGSGGSVTGWPGGGLGGSVGGSVGVGMGRGSRWSVRTFSGASGSEKKVTKN